MNNIIIGYISAAIYATVSFASAIIIYKISKDPEYSRKAIHILCGCGWIVFKVFFEGTIHPFLIALVFLIIVIILHIKNVRFIEREDKDIGTVIYGISAAGMALMSFVFPSAFDSFGIGLTGLAVGDGMAGIIGKVCRNNRKIFRRKTIAGTAACIICSFIAFLALILVFHMPLNLIQIAVLAIIAGAAELFGGKADNLIIPFSLFSVSWIMMCG